MNKTNSVFRLVFFLPTILLMLFGCNDVAEDKKLDIERSHQNQGNAENIISALDHFFIDNYHYPKDLDELVPTYLQELPKTYNGKNFGYYTSIQDGYGVCYALDTVACCYRQNISFWDCSPIIGH